MLPEAINDVNKFEPMNLRDTYDETGFQSVSTKKRNIRSGQGNRKHTVGVRPLGGNLGGLAGKVSAFE